LAIAAALRKIVAETPSVTEARALRRVVCIDVRSTQEFALGHPAGAVRALLEPTTPR
jgi:rhodanese-related sulfurtransferase